MTKYDPVRTVLVEITFVDDALAVITGLAINSITSLSYKYDSSYSTLDTEFIARKKDDDKYEVDLPGKGVLIPTLLFDPSSEYE